MTSGPQPPADQVFVEALSVCINAFRVLESVAPKPVLKEADGRRFYRYEEQNLEAALIQKLARVCSGLQALWALLKMGLYQEAGILLRVIDELNEDIIFLAIPFLDEEGILREVAPELTDRHRQYLADFYMEDFPAGQPLAPRRPRNRVRRDKIQAAIVRGMKVNPSDGKEVVERMQTVYSGYVHAASVYVLEMYGGEPPRFFVGSMTGSSMDGVQRKQGAHYFFRGLMSFQLVAVVFRQHQLAGALFNFKNQFAEKIGHQDAVDIDEAIQRIRRQGTPQQ